MEWMKGYRLINMTYGEKMRSEGWMNCWDNPPKEPGIYEVEERSGKVGKVIDDAIAIAKKNIRGIFWRAAGRSLQQRVGRWQK